VSFGCAGVTVNSATANSATEITANITVAEDAAGGSCDVTVSGGATGSTAIICANAFTVVPTPPCTITVSPNPVNNGFLLPRLATITITGSNCTFDDTTTVSIEGRGVRILGSPTISGSTITLRCYISPGLFGGPLSSNGDKTVTVTTGAETATATLTVE
jgi:hypothetical protein